MSYEKALSLIEGGGSGGGITAYKIAYDEETYAAYVEVTYAELLENVKKGLVLFIDDSNEGTCTTYIVSGIDDNYAATLYALNATNIYHQWAYTNGKYVLDSGD